MFKLGEKQILKMVKKVEFGVYLANLQDTQEEERVLLPAKQVPQNLEMGEEIEVFLYKDSKDRLIATTNEPKLQIGETALLRVQQTGQMGAFLDWGLEKDLFLPFREQTAKVKVYHYLRCDSTYKKDDKVTGVVYELSDNFGAFVAVDNVYSALIPKKELIKKLYVGEQITARVMDVKEDGKLDLSIREKSYLQMNTDAQVVLERLERENGRLPFTDKAAPEVIREEMNMSKNEFKRAIGNLLKAGKIEITENEIKLKSND